METKEKPAWTGLYPLPGRESEAGARTVALAPATLPVHRGDALAGFALVDAAVLAALKQRHWKLGTQGYAYTDTSEGMVSLHRYLFGLRRGEPLEVHHRNAERLDCRRANLIVLTADEHKAAHGMRPRAAIFDPDAARAQNDVHPAARRGLTRWLEQARGAEDACLGEAEAKVTRARKLPKTLTEDELARLLAAPNLAVPTGLRDRCMLELMVRCGLRVSEVCGLHLRDVDWQAGEIRVRSEVAKGGREAVVYLDAPTQQLLERWKDVRRSFGAGKPHLFVIVRQAQRGQPLSRLRVYKMVRRRAAKAGIGWPVHPHVLRHTFATQALADGFTIREVQRLMRHARLETTAIYLDVRDVDLRSKIRRRGQS